MLGTWGKLPQIGFNKDYGNFDWCRNLEINDTVNIETQYCLADIGVWDHKLTKM